MFDFGGGMSRLSLFKKADLYAWHDQANETIQCIADRHGAARDYSRMPDLSFKKQLWDNKISTTLLVFQKAGDDGVVQSKLIEFFLESSEKDKTTLAKDISRRFKTLEHFELISIARPQDNIAIGTITPFGVETAEKYDEKFNEWINKLGKSE